eukprot:TCONS_00052511-protein
MALVNCSTIDVQTKEGVGSINLCIGSITKCEDVVDVLVISAYPGDYTPVHGTVIGALQNDLGIRVRELAKKKEEDQRKLLSCWWSNELPKKSKFKRIMCFEGSFKKNAQPPSTVSEVFRSLVSLSKEEPISVMMPLLSSGNQRYNQKLMLRLIVEASIHWMEIGLPMKELKIVLYQRDTSEVSKVNKILVDLFEEMRQKTNKLAMKNKNEFKYDFYLTYAPGNDEVAAMVVKSIKEIQPNYKIHEERQKIDPEKAFQDHIYETMSTCARVIVLLSPNFMDDVACIEKYNIGMCYARNTRRNYLAPIYIEEISNMPTYMGLIQYIDARPVSEASIQNVLSTLCVDQKPTKDVKTTQQQEHSPKQISLENAYDLFISYSHQNYDVALKVYHVIKEQKPHWRIFFDQDELKAGHSWQSKLYHSIESSRIVIALISKTYLQSKVCQEEFNLAQSLSMDHTLPHSLRLFRVRLEDFQELPLWCGSKKNMFDFTAKDPANLSKFVMYMDHEFDNYLYLSERDILTIDNVTSKFRSEFARSKYPIIPDVDFTQECGMQENLNSSQSGYDVILISHQDHITIVQSLKERLLCKAPSLKILLVTNKDEKTIRLNVFDETRLVMSFLGKSFFEDVFLMEQFNTALYRHRFKEYIIACPVILGELPAMPVYPKLSFCLFSLTDKQWHNKDGKVSVERFVDNVASVVSNILFLKPTTATSFKTLFNILELREWGDETYGDRKKLKPLAFDGAMVVSANDRSIISVRDSMLMVSGSHALSSPEPILEITSSGLEYSIPEPKEPEEKSPNLQQQAEKTETTSTDYVEQKPSDSPRSLLLIKKETTFKNGQAPPRSEVATISTEYDRQKVLDSNESCSLPITKTPPPKREAEEPELLEQAPPTDVNSGEIPSSELNQTNEADPPNNKANDSRLKLKRQNSKTCCIH